MKRLISLMLLAASGLAQADSTQDAYNAGAAFGKSNKGQGTSGVSSAAPADVIPGYTATPAQSGYYGGVTGGDGGIGDKGQAALQENAAGQAAIDSGAKNPAPVIDPNADFITNGKSAESGADAIVAGTSQQCTTKVVSKSTFENYSCDHDVYQVQTCGRTGSIVVTGTTESRQSELVLNAVSSSPVQEADYWVRYDFVAPDTGVITSGTVEWLQPKSPNYHSDRLKWTLKAFDGQSTQLINYTNPMNISPQNVTKGQTISIYIRYNTDGDKQSGADQDSQGIRSGLYVYRITFPMTIIVNTRQVSTAWSESCGFAKSTAVASAGTTCTDPGGTRSASVDGQDYSQTQSCWQYSDAYIVKADSTGNCGELMNDANCTESSHTCTDSDAATGYCLHETETWQCQRNWTSTGLLCGGDYLCQSGDCDETNGAGDSGFDLAVAKLAGLASAGDDVRDDQIDIKAFTGESMACRKAVAGFSNCCADSGWGNSAGLSQCNSEEQAIGKAKAKKVVVDVGSKCAQAVLGVCVQKKEVYCVFGGMLARIIQEQGRRDQLHVSFGSGDNPDCRGITVDELQAINFDAINFSDFYSTLIANQKIPDNATMVQQVKDRIAAQVAAQGGAQ